MEFLGVIAAKIVESLVAPVGQWLSECTIAPVGEWLGYSFHHSSNIENLKKQKNELKDNIKRVQHLVDGAIRNAEEIEADVNSWLEKVDLIMENAEQVLEDEEKANTRCSNGTCLNLKQRHQQSKKAKKIVQEIEAQKNRKFDKVSYRPALPGIMTKANKDYMTFDSRVSTVEGLMEALRDANINMIGVWGMPGVGKTTLVREVANQVKENKLFDDVAIAEVTQSPDMRRIQEELAGMLDLKFDIVEPVTVRARRLWQRLTSKHNKILVILDDVWEKLEWEKIGIPVTDCKVEEAWNLFEKMAGDSVKDPNLRSTATEVAKECAGLPIALVTVSKALKDKSLYEWKDALKQLRRPAPGHLSQMQSTIYSSIELSCSHLEKLRFLYVNGGDKSLQIIPETFFDGMRKLKVLDFTQMQLSSLPSSLHLLSNLTTLCLDFCAFEDMTVIGELKNLEILSLMGSNVSQLPREIGLLTHLRLLDLSKCSKLEVIPRNVLSSLVELEELYMGNSFDHWETEGLNNGRNNATLAELMHLSHLVTLEIHIRDASVLPKDLLLFKKLERYRICVGDVWDWAEKRETSRRLKLKLNTRFQLEFGIKMLLNGVEDLWLDELKGVESTLYELDTEGFQQLKHLRVQNNADIKYIIYSSVWLIVFPALETFSLKNMINMEGICHGQLHSKSFGNLRVVKFENCNKLKFVFSLSIAKELSQLRELEVRECSIMGAIVIKEEPKIEGKEIDMTLFPQLRVLTVQHLPKLVSFFSTQNSFITNVGEITPEGEHDFLCQFYTNRYVLYNK
uniref:AAA+ ATPase domain-containing protein n=1 Tax=Fagus sylvatica TaxID=28930 RepID=A0A2N9H2P3_FAGSY